MSRIRMMTLFASTFFISGLWPSTAMADDCNEHGHHRDHHGHSQHECARDQGGNAYGHCDVGDAQTFVVFPDDVDSIEDVAVDWNLEVAYFDGRANFGTAGNDMPSFVLPYKLDGTPYGRLQIEGENTDEEHAVVGMARDRNGNLVVTSTQLGLVRFIVHQDVNGDLYWTQDPMVSGPFTAFFPGVPSIPNGIAVDPMTGDFYVTDSLQGSLWRVSEDFVSVELVTPDPFINFFTYGVGTGARLGANCVRFSEDYQNLYFTFTGGFGVNGQIFRVPTAALHLSNPFDIYNHLQVEYVFEGDTEVLADGLAVSHNGNHVYTTLGGADRIDVLNVAEDGSLSTWSSITEAFGEDVGLAMPANLQMDPQGRWALVVNHPIDIAVPPGGWTVETNPNRAYWMYLGEHGAPLP